MSTTTIDRVDQAASLRTLHRANAGFSLICGTLMLLESGWLAPRVDLAKAVVVAIGCGLIAWSAALVWLAAQPAEIVRRMTVPVAVADASWVVGSIALVALRQPTSAGVSLVCATGLIVVGFAVGGFTPGRQQQR